MVAWCCGVARAGLDSSAPFRYDPNDLSMGDDDGSGSPSSAIKNLNFSKIARDSDGHGGLGSGSLSRDSESGSATSTTTRNGSAFSPDWMREAAAAGEAESEGKVKGHTCTSSGSSGIEDTFVTRFTTSIAFSWTRI